MSGAALNAETARLTGLFTGAGAMPVDAALLQPAAILLDLYGEDIRGRAYVTTDPLRGEMMLRPDFTVPVVQMHMETRADPARYTYAGPVFRKQDHDDTRAIEYMQVGFEVFDGQNPAKADAEVFATVLSALDGLPIRASTGDLGVLMAAVRGLGTTDARKAALMRHIWRPKRFRALLDRFGGRTPPPASRTTLLAATYPFADAAPDVGLRTRDEVAARIDALRDDAAAAPISGEEIALIDTILGLRETATHVHSALVDIAQDLPAIAPVVANMARRNDALAARGIDVARLDYEGSYGRTTLEYYDGFVFGFYATGADLPPVATGGRYDTLTAVLGQGDALPAVGAVVRPDMVLALRGMA